MLIYIFCAHFQCLPACGPILPPICLWRYNRKHKDRQMLDKVMLLCFAGDTITWTLGVRTEKIMAAFRGMHVWPAKHSYASVTDGQTDDGQSDPYVSLCFAGDTKNDTMHYRWWFHSSTDILWSKISPLADVMQIAYRLFFVVTWTFCFAKSSLSAISAVIL